MEKLCKGLNIPQKYNIFSLFEQCGTIEKNIEDRTVLADVLSKFEKLVLTIQKSLYLHSNYLHSYSYNYQRRTSQLRLVLPATCQVPFALAATKYLSSDRYHSKLGRDKLVKTVRLNSFSKTLIESLSFFHPCLL